jgi:RNA polymerase sigma-70 factor (ECF subfamily)
MEQDRLDSEAIAASLATPADFALIFDRHFDAIYVYLRKRVGESLADELASQAFLLAFDRRQSFDGSRPDARPWLYGIATNLLRTHRRQQARQLRAYARAAAPVGVDPLEGADDRLDASRLRAQLSALLAALPREDSDPLLLYAWAELSYGEIAEALALPLGTVKSRISRARRRIREQLRLDRTTGLRNESTSLEIDCE